MNASTCCHRFIRINSDLLALHGKNLWRKSLLISSLLTRHNAKSVSGSSISSLAMLTMTMIIILNLGNLHYIAIYRIIRAKKTQHNIGGERGRYSTFYYYFRIRNIQSFSPWPREENRAKNKVYCTKFFNFFSWIPANNLFFSCLYQTQKNINQNW